MTNNFSAVYFIALGPLELSFNMQMIQLVVWKILFFSTETIKLNVDIMYYIHKLKLPYACPQLKLYVMAFSSSSAYRINCMIIHDKLYCVVLNLNVSTRPEFIIDISSITLKPLV